MVKFQKLDSNSILLLIYIIGDYGVPSTLESKKLLVTNIADTVVNGNFTFHKYLDGVAVKCNNNKALHNTGGFAFYTYLSEISTSGKLSQGLSSQERQDELLKLIDEWEEKHPVYTGSAVELEAEGSIENEPINETDGLNGTDKPDNPANTEDMPKPHSTDLHMEAISAVEEFRDSEESDNEQPDQTDNQGDIEMELGKVDSLALFMELVKRATGGNEQKSLQVSISQDSIDQIGSLVSSMLTDKPTVEPEQLKYDWGDRVKQAPDYKEVIGVDISKVISTLQTKKALIIEGVPGTGKSILMFNLISKFAYRDADKFKVVSFNQNTDYTDFIEGIKCVNGTWQYVDGVFLDFCKQANSNRNGTYLFCIDEISRGNTEAILGEVMTAIEARDTIVTLQSGHELVVPSNLYIVGTMNTLDTNSKFIDRATADRFAHIRLEPQWNEQYTNSIKRSVSTIGASLELLNNRLKTLCQYMTEINESLLEDSGAGADNLIGTRALAVQSLDNSILSRVIENSIVPDVKSKMIVCSRTTAAKLYDYIEKLKAMYSAGRK